MPLSAPRNTRALAPGALAYKVAANVTIHAGALVALDGGYLAPGKAATGLVAVGRALESFDNAGGAAGAGYVRVEPGVFAWTSAAAGDAIAQAEVGSTCFIVDDETVAKTNGAGTRSAAGVVRMVEGAVVWVETR